MAGAVGLLALRTAGVSFMIVTLMFAQAGYLTILYFGQVTGGDEGFVVDAAARRLFGFDLSSDVPRYLAALALFAAAMAGCLWLVRSPFGRVMVAMRENEERSRMLGYDPFRVKLAALVISGVYAGAAGASYGLLFGYVGGSFATIQYSILPMLYVLLGGAGTVGGGRPGGPLVPPRRGLLRGELRPHRGGGAALEKPRLGQWRPLARMETVTLDRALLATGFLLMVLAFCV